MIELIPDAVPEWVCWTLWFIFSACIGSFLNVCIYRVPREQSIVRPRSRCPSCERPIAWRDNIPLLSYLLLQGRCRRCRVAIHWRYPAVELLAALLSVAVVSRFGWNAQALVYVVFVWALLAVSAIDFEHRIIPFSISIGGLLLGWSVSLLVPQLQGTTYPLVALWRALLGAVVGCGLLYLTGSIGSFVFRKEAMGLGDVDLLAMAGSVLGWRLVTLAFFIAPLLAIGPGIVVLLRRRSHEIPYGPYLSLAALLSLLFGERLIRMSGIEETIRLLWSYYSGMS